MSCIGGIERQFVDSRTAVTAQEQSLSHDGYNPRSLCSTSQRARKDLTRERLAVEPSIDTAVPATCQRPSTARTFALLLTYQ